jgi:hypothetical protein
MTLSQAKRELAAAAAARELLAAADIWMEWPWWSRRHVARALARRPGARTWRQIYTDLPEREQVLRRK